MARARKVARPGGPVAVIFLVDSQASPEDPAFEAGTTYELPPASARRWIRRGRALPPEEISAAELHNIRTAKALARGELPEEEEPRPGEEPPPENPGADD